MAHVGPQAGLPFRDNYGVLICLLGAKARMDTQSLVELNKNMDIGEKLDGWRQKY